jgi:hypothetical protein
MKNLILLFVFVLGGIALNAQNHTKSDLAVFPNPTTEYFSVEDHNDAIGELSVISLAGRKVKTFTYNKGEQFYVGDLAKGMYLLQILDKQKRILTTQKLEKR